MAYLLYRLGTFAYRRRWWVVSAWLAVMVAVGSSAVAFSGTLSNNFTIPGTESQRVLNQLRDTMPEAVGGMGTIVFQNPDGEFTPAQQEAVSAALTNVGGLDGVEAVIDPFQTAQQLADSRADIENGKVELEAGARELIDGAAQLDAGQAQLDAQRAQFEAGKTFLPAEQIDATVAQLDAAQAEIDAQRRELDEGQADLDAARVELERGERLLEASSGIQFVSDDGTTAVASVQFTTAVDAVTPETREAVQEAANPAAEAALNVEYSKEIVQDISEIFGPAEVIGLLVAAVVLLVMLGTLVAAGLPLLMAIVGVGIGVGITFALTGIIQMSSISPVLALMLGLAVGIDYSLFIVNRHRTQLLHGMPMQESIARATGTAGNAVLFAGITVIIALAALAVPGLPFLTILGLSAAGTVAIAVLVALTLTPALLGVMGRRVISKRRWKTAPAVSEAEANEHAVDDSYAGGRGWGGMVTRRPLLTVLAGVVVLGVLALPALELRVGLPDGGSEPADSTAYEAYALVGEKFGEGTNGPLLVVGELPAIEDEGDRTDLRLDVAERLAEIGDVAA
ncbi:MMPL family transporter, partial [Arthrobacter sp. 35/47]|uniref:MMPL family transporter n=1 Tax=Arthrobacter sp. 35/47 TaxID=269454 RepID=UPI00055AD0AB